MHSCLTIYEFGGGVLGSRLPSGVPLRAAAALHI
jgi:hypothetical protein